MFVGVSVVALESCFTLVDQEGASWSVLHFLVSLLYRDGKTATSFWQMGS